MSSVIKKFRNNTELIAAVAVKNLICILEASLMKS